MSVDATDATVQSSYIASSRGLDTTKESSHSSGHLLTFPPKTWIKRNKDGSGNEERGAKRETIHNMMITSNSELDSGFEDDEQHHE
eukprot:scaffold224_cov276-Chaetoceros_neogracile.AAC.36